MFSIEILLYAGTNVDTFYVDSDKKCKEYCLRVEITNTFYLISLGTSSWDQVFPADEVDTPYIVVYLSNEARDYYGNWPYVIENFVSKIMLSVSGCFCVGLGLHQVPDERDIKPITTPTGMAMISISTALAIS